MTVLDFILVELYVIRTRSVSILGCDLQNATINVFKEFILAQL